MNLYGPEMRDIRNNEIIRGKIRKAEDDIEDFIQEAINQMEISGRFTPSEIGDVMLQWVNATVNAAAYDKIPNEKYPQYQEIDSALNGFFVKGYYYYLHEVCGNIQIFCEDKNIRLEPVQIVFRNSLIDVRLKDPNITLYFSLRDDHEEHRLNYELYQILQNLW